jgi:LAS superfamily LD-carboxypeptidase LdcB
VTERVEEQFANSRDIPDITFRYHLQQQQDREGCTQLSCKSVQIQSRNCKILPTLFNVSRNNFSAPKALFPVLGVIAGLLLLVFSAVRQNDQVANESASELTSTQAQPGASDVLKELAAVGGPAPAPELNPVGQITGVNTPIDKIANQIADSRAIGDQVSGAGYINGKINEELLHETSNGCVLSVVAVQPYEEMLVAARDAGFSLEVSGCYRTYASQSASRQNWCNRNLCQYSAVPGYSKHGKGLAVDFKTGDRAIMFEDPVFAWLAENSSQYGFFHPYWAGPKGSAPEPWHWEFGERTVSQSLAERGFVGKVDPSVIVPPSQRSGS